MAGLQVGREFLVLPTPCAGLLLPGHPVPGGDVGLQSCRTAPRSKRRLGRRALGVKIRSLPPTPRNARRVELWHLDVLGPPNPADGNGLPRLGAGVRGHRHGVHRPSQKTRDASLVLIEVPPQSEENKPFLVHGAVVEGKAQGNFFSIVRRRNDEMASTHPANVHANLTVGRAFLRRGEIPRN